MLEDILIELLDSPSKPKSSNNEANKAEENLEKTEDGLAWIENGKVFIKNPHGNGQVPSIIPCKGLRLFVNGKVIKHTVFVKEQDEIMIESEDEEVKGGFEVSVAEDKLAAFISLKMSYTVIRLPKDATPTNSLLLKFEKLFVKKKWDFSYEDVLNHLQQRGINTGIKFEKLQEKLATEKDDTFLLAEGNPPTKSVDEVVEILFQMEDMHVFDIFKDMQNVDFRQSYITSVSKGDVLAIKHKGCSGRSGISVTGEIIPPKEPNKCTLKAGNGVELIDDGFKIIAITDGQPKVESAGQLWELSVDPLLVHMGNVNTLTGNIKFKGNVKVLGSIVDFSLVDATETVLITGMVDNSKVVAGNSIKIGEKVIASTLNAGGVSAFCNQILPYINDIKDGFYDMREAVSQLLNSSVTMGLNIDDKNFGQLLFLLKEKKFDYLDKIIGAFIALVTKAEFQLPEELLTLSETFSNSFLGIRCRKLLSLDEFKTIIDNLELVYLIAKRLKERKAHIIMDYAQNSKIRASGDVYVQGQGCFTTEIYSGGSTKINGVFRGGQIYSDGNVFVNELGTEVGTRTVIKVPKDRVISINKVYQGSYIRIGHRRYRFDVPAANVIAKVDERGNLVIKGLPLREEIKNLTVNY